MNETPEWARDAMRRAAAMGIEVNWDAVLPSLAARPVEEAKAALERFLNTRRAAAPSRRKGRQRRTGHPRMRHGSEGRFELGSRAVADPDNPGETVEVAANVKASTLAYMRAQGRIDEAQFQAGELFRGLYERVRTCGAVDYAKPRVDGGRMPDALAIAALDASRALAGIAQLKELGKTGYRILARILGEGMSLEAAAAAFGAPGGLKGRRAEGWISGRLVECLDVLVDHFDFEAKGKERASIRAAVC